MTGQLFRLMSRDEEAALRSSIQRFGVLVPLVLDADGELIDGYHRRRLALELGKPTPTVQLDVRGDEALGVARDLNLARRHLDRAERAAYVVQRKTGTEIPPSNRQLAEEVGADESTVREDLRGAGNPAPDQVRGRDGKRYPARSRPKPPPDPEPEAPPKLDPPKLDVLPAGVEIRCGDARDHWPDDRADLAVFSPPYNVGVTYDGDDTADGLPDHEWRELLKLTCAVLVEGWHVGRIVINHPIGVDRRPFRLLVPIMAEILESAGCEIEGLIVWDKGTTGNRTSWGSWRLPSEPALRDRCEILTVARTPNPIEPSGLVNVTEKGEGRLASPWLDSPTFTRLTQNVWAIPPESAQRVGHPAPFPVQLASDVIRLYGWPGCTVIDPFAGSGTTAVAALKLNPPARVMLVDQSDAYCTLARERIIEETT